MILFSAVEHEDCLAAYNWHRGFTAANNALFPRHGDDFESLVMLGSVWAAKDTNGDYLALAYSTFDEVEKVCELGGLMVATQARGQGLGSMMMRLTLGHALVEEDLLRDPKNRIVSHVLKSNQSPRRVLEDQLKFHIAKEVAIPEKDLPGLEADPDGFVRGDEYEITLPDSVIALAAWAETWTATVLGGRHIELRAGVTMHDWAAALREMAER